jgi:hypothetical protein
MHVTGVSGSRLDENIALLKTARLLGILNHAATNAILDRATGVEELAFSNYVGEDKKEKKDIKTYVARI